MSTTHHVDVQQIKQAAVGKWQEILATLGGIPGEILDGQHHPCPRCDGKDRFRMVDKDAGAVFCNQCFSKDNGDGIAALQWLTGMDFKSTLAKLAAHLGVQQSNGHAPRNNNDLAIDQIDFPTLNPDGFETLVHRWCTTKQPITKEAVKAYDGRYCRWPKRSRTPFACVSFAGRDTRDDSTPHAVLLYQLSGLEFPEGGNLGARKTHLVKGSKESWIYPGTTAGLQAATTIVKCEGLPDCLALYSAGLPVGWVAITNACGAGSSSAKRLDYAWAVGKQVVIVGDADTPGEDGARRFSRAFAATGAADVRHVKLPYDVTPDHGKDLRDWLNEGHTAAEFVELVEQAEHVTAATVAEWKAEERKRRAERLEITIGADESRVLDEAITALGTRENVYQRGGSLVHVVSGVEPPKGIARPSEAPRIVLMKFARIKEHLSDAASWWTTNGEERERIHPPDWVVRGIDARGEWQGIPRIEAVVESPILRADGTVLQAAGYDSLTGIFYRPQVEFPSIPEAPSHADALRARDILLEVVRDFPYATEAHRAGWLAATLTPFARYAVAGPAPLFLFDANVRGSGKSLQADATSMIATGREAARMSLPRDDDEFRKRITALAVAGEQLILLDNVAGTLGNPSLDAALTATSWSDRILGQTAMASGVPLYATWYATGNNVVLAADTARRTVHIRLESREESPEERTGFCHPDLLQWVRAERPRLTAAAVTILSAYCAAGRPNMGLKPWGSFEAWSNLVRQAIVWIGMPDPGATRTALTSQSDREAAALRQLLTGWQEVDPTGAGMTVGKLLCILGEGQADHDAIRGALWELCPPKDGKNINPLSLGMKLHHLRQRVIGGAYLERRDSNKGSIWVVKQSDAGDTTWTSDTSLDSARAGAHTHTHEIREATGTSVTSSPSASLCDHSDVEETSTHDGYVNRQCRACGTCLTCTKGMAT